MQKRPTKMVIELRGLEYEERLKILGIINLETWRKIRDLLQIFKIKKGFEDLDIKNNEERKGQSRRHNSHIIIKFLLS